jgi:hypothetical protein
MENTTMQFQSDDIKEIALALSNAQAEMEYAGKEVENAFFKSSYADLAAVVKASRPALAKHGLSVVQLTNVAYDGSVIMITQLNHVSGQWIRGAYPVKPVKADPQALGSAMTYARRYTYSAMTGVVAHGEDDDGNAASNRKESAAARNKRFAALKETILTSDNPAETWHNNIEEIKEFKSDPEHGEALYNDLMQAGKQRKEQLDVIMKQADEFKEKE